MNRQDGPLLVGGVDETTPGRILPLKIDPATGELLVTGGGGGGGDVNLTEVGGVAITLGQKAMAASLPVVVASDQSALTVQQATATNLKAQAEAYQGGSAVGAANPLQVSLANTGANGTPVAISAASLPLPTGAATEATLTGVLTSANFAAAFGTAGTSDAQVLSVQGIASMTPVQVSQATASNLNAQVVGNVAHDDADAGNPVKTGGKAVTSLPTAVAANDRTNHITDTTGRAFVRTGLEGPAGNYWDAQHVPAANTQATATKTTAGSGVRNVCTGFTVTLCATSSAPSAVQLTVAVIDGSSGGTTYLWRSAISLPAVAGAITSFVRSGLWLVGTADTGLTIEFSAAGGANTQESVTMEGTTVAE